MVDSSAAEWWQVGIASIGLAMLCFYSLETRRIRQATLAQSDASRRPFITIHATEPHLIFKNSGAGPALDVKAIFSNGDDYQPDPIGAVGVTDLFHVDYLLAPVTYEMILQTILKFGYTDTAGKPYWTTFRNVKTGWVTDTGTVEVSLTIAGRLKTWKGRLGGKNLQH
ncbi:MAG: hypothetical protein ACRYGF_07085 [Janthinobacterium lividum]